MLLADDDADDVGIRAVAADPDGEFDGFWFDGADWSDNPRWYCCGGSEYKLLRELVLDELLLMLPAAPTMIP